MQHARRTLTIICLGLAGLSLSGCFEVEEDYTLHSDGSATMAFRFTIGTQILGLMSMGDEDPIEKMRKQMKDGKASLEEIDNVRSAEIIDEQDADGYHTGFKIVVDDMTQLQSTLDQINETMDSMDEEPSTPEETDDLNKITITNDGDVFHYQRLVHMGAGAIRTAWPTVMEWMGW
ncbi:MAG: hypothetical protein CMJ49_06500 [Planctomycetaceae bacterium]|nr:hypothetical protein [Planctomycetaceae bacterium]